MDSYSQALRTYEVVLNEGRKRYFFSSKYKWLLLYFYLYIITKFSLFLSLDGDVIFFLIGRRGIVFLVGWFGSFFFLILNRASVCDDSRHDTISRNVRDGSTTVHEPIDGEDIRESIGGSAPSKHVVVCGDDQNEAGRGDGSRTDASHGSNDDKQQKVRGRDIFPIQDGQPDTGANKVNGTTIHIYGRTKGDDKTTDYIRDDAGRPDRFDRLWDGGSMRQWKRQRVA